MKPKKHYILRLESMILNFKKRFKIFHTFSSFETLQLTNASHYKLESVSLLCLTLYGFFTVKIPSFSS